MVFRIPIHQVFNTKQKWQQETVFRTGNKRFKDIYIALLSLFRSDQSIDLDKEVRHDIYILYKVLSIC